MPPYLCYAAQVQRRCDAAADALRRYCRPERLFIFTGRPATRDISPMKAAIDWRLRAQRGGTIAEAVKRTIARRRAVISEDAGAGDVAFDDSANTPIIKAPSAMPPLSLLRL